MLCCLADTFFLRRIWRKNATELLMSAAKLSGFVIMIMGLTGIGAETFPALFDRRIIPFIMDNLIGTMFTALVVAIFFMPFLVDYGLLEFCGVLLRPVMRPLFRTPGTSAVIAVTAFVGSFTIGVLATEQMYREGKFTARESVIITTGFSTTSVSDESHEGTSWLIGTLELLFLDNSGHHLRSHGDYRPPPAHQPKSR